MVDRSSDPRRLDIRDALADVLLVLVGDVDIDPARALDAADRVVNGPREAIEDTQDFLIGVLRNDDRLKENSK